MSKFTSGELKVMRLLWAFGELKPSELQEKFPEPIKNSALRSYLTILVAKGHVRRRKVGKAYFYKAVTQEQRAFSTMLADLVKTFCSGSVEELVMTLVRREKLTVDELLELKRLAEREEAGMSTGDPITKPSRRKRTSSKQTTKRGDLP